MSYDWIQKLKTGSEIGGVADRRGAEDGRRSGRPRRRGRGRRGREIG